MEQVCAVVASRGSRRARWPASEDVQNTVLHNQYTSKAYGQKIQLPTVTHLKSLKSRSLLLFPHQKTSLFDKRKTRGVNMSLLEQTSIHKTCEVDENKTAIGRQLQPGPSQKLTKNHTISLYCPLYAMEPPGFRGLVAQRKKARQAISHADWNTNNSNGKKCTQVNVDIRKVVEAVHKYFLQTYKTPDALKQTLVNRCETILDKIADRLIVEMTHHIQSQLARAECAEKNVPQDIPLRPEEPSSGQLGQQSCSALFSASFLEDVIAELLFRIVFTANMLVPKDQKIPNCALSKTAIRLVHPLLKEIQKSEVKVVNQDEEICENDVDRVVDSVHDNCFKQYGSFESVQKEIQGNSDAFAKQIASLVIAEMADFQIESSEANNTSSCEFKNLEPKNIIRKVQNLFCWRHQDRPSSPTATVLSSKVLEEIIHCLMSKMLPPPANIPKCQVLENQRDVGDTERKEMLAELGQGVLMKISGREIWYTKDATIIQRVNESWQNDPQTGGDCSISQTLGSSLAVPDDGSAVCKDIKRTSRLLFRQISNPNFMAFQAADSCSSASDLFSPSLTSTTSIKAGNFVEVVLDNVAHPFDESELLKPCVTMLSSSVIEEIVATFLSKIIFNCPDLNLGTKDLSSLSQLNRITQKLTKALCISILENKIKISQDIAETRFVHPKDYQVVEKVVNAAYSNVYELTQSHHSIYQNLAKKGDVLADTIARLLVAEICGYHFQPCSPRGRLSDQYLSIESSYIVQQVLSNIGATPSPLGQPEVSSCQGLYAPFLEEIVSQFLTKLFLRSTTAQRTRTQSNSFEAELSKIASRLINSVLKELLKSEIKVVKPTVDAPCLHSEDEDFIAVMVDSVYLNALNQSGSRLKLFKDLISGCTLVSERIASIVIKEISNYQLQPFLAAGVAYDSYTDMEVSQIVGKVLNDVSSEFRVHSNVDNLVDAVTEKLPETCKEPDADLPSIIPHLKDVHLDIEPDITSTHFAVLSIKTKPLEVLETWSVLQTGQTLESLRRVALSDKSVLKKSCEAEQVPPNFEVECGSQRRASLDVVGRLDVKPMKLVSRNSFFNLHRPDLARVELLQEVKNSQDYINRMIAHDIFYEGKDGDSDEIIRPDVPCCRALGLVKKLTAVAKKKKKCCACCTRCPCCKGTKTVNSIALRLEEDPECNFNENANTFPANYFMGNLKCVFGGQQFPNIGSRFNGNLNSATCARNPLLDIKMTTPAWQSFQAGSTLLNCPFPAAATPLSHYKRPRTINKTSAPFVMK